MRSAIALSLPQLSEMHPTLTTVTLTGAQLKAALEQQFDNPAVGSNRILQVTTQHQNGLS